MKRNEVNYAAMAKSAPFKALMNSKKRFIVPLTLFFFAFYFTLPILTAYSTILNEPAIGSISWAWVFAFAQFAMTWALCIIYARRAAKFDKMVQQLNREWGGGRG
ncbi:DUF485 domain-containing protein [Paenibacillus sp. 481]|uniref:DUF485 domain-containing protein n=1 Tax=Paenibacillus sp. 481 TaxID=2835869 RepID=UPI001E5D1FF8|nr:DUF485 domain-containing protein [Paenibacillus sp. 481]UHA72831.1 DUF485 domain-containing protein [Paenibacillus sp. 481]